jgi:hypothetical protein
VKYIQAQAFSEEIKALSETKPIPRESSLRELHPELQNGVLWSFWSEVEFIMLTYLIIRATQEFCHTTIIYQSF